MEGGRSAPCFCHAGLGGKDREANTGMQRPDGRQVSPKSCQVYPGRALRFPARPALVTPSTNGKKYAMLEEAAHAEDKTCEMMVVGFAKPTSCLPDRDSL